MLSHIHLGIADYDRAMRFYEPLFEALVWRKRFGDPERGWAGWMPADTVRPLFLIGRPFDGNPAGIGNGQMIALLASDRATVDRAYAMAMAQGASDEGAPGPRPHYHPDYYGAYFRDPDGNKLCICCHQPED